ncbi:hypothetical protein M0R45_030829 [Rubus argutus]|uniref:Uncharacterized protein n=1 Tax=Rubus argutus TaxID=59490 RepID=A0AAW1WCZ9_RUBAR
MPHLCVPSSQPSPQTKTMKPTLPTSPLPCSPNHHIISISIYYPKSPPCLHLNPIPPRRRYATASTAELHHILTDTSLCTYIDHNPRGRTTSTMISALPSSASCFLLSCTATSAHNLFPTVMRREEIGIGEKK